MRVDDRFNWFFGSTTLRQTLTAYNRQSWKTVVLILQFKRAHVCPRLPVWENENNWWLSLKHMASASCCFHTSAISRPHKNGKESNDKSCSLPRILLNAVYGR